MNEERIAVSYRASADVLEKDSGHAVSLAYERVLLTMNDIVGAFCARGRKKYRIREVGIDSRRVFYLAGKGF